MKITGREIIIAAVAILVLLGIGYFINDNSQNKSDDSTQEDQVNLDEQSSEENNEEEGKVQGVEGVTSIVPAPNSETALADVPQRLVIKFDRQITAGSQITVVSDKNIDVVTGANRITADFLELSAPINITVVGTYTVNYNVNWLNGDNAKGDYKFVVK